MNAVEIEEAISALAEQPFDRAEFPYAFLEAFGNKQTTLKRLRSGANNKSDLGGVLQTNNIHIAVCDAGGVSKTLGALKSSPATIKAKAQFILATDGDAFEAEDMESGETVACSYADFPNHFGFFLPLAGITTVKQVRESSFDIRATSRLNRLYVQLLKDNPDWDTAERRPDMNHFMARLIFSFFAEDTDIFHGARLFTGTIEQLSASDSGNTHEVVAELFRAMNTKIADREAAGVPRWANGFPYVNGGLFSGSLDVPRFSRIARSYLLHIGNLDWTKINPDIFGSMIQAVADDEERGALGMHYTSVPNILKVLNPLFLDDLREKLAEAGDNPRKLLNLRGRMARIRVFDPACGSGNFLVIAYKQMREIEAAINTRRGEAGRPSDIPLTNFRGIELRDFPAEIARLALIIAEFQCDVLYRGQKLALAEFLPLDAMNWITCGNALRLDWLSICPPTGAGVKLHGGDLFSTPLDQAQIDFENEGGETYICGNPPYKGTKNQTPDEKQDLKQAFGDAFPNWKVLDYVCGWFAKAAEYGAVTNADFAFVSTNSICQGNQVPVLWPIIFRMGYKIAFAHTSFKWKNLAANNAGVTVIIVGVSKIQRAKNRLFDVIDGQETQREVPHINAYLVPSSDLVVERKATREPPLADMKLGNQPYEGGFLVLNSDELKGFNFSKDEELKFVRKFIGSSEFINGAERYCLWLTNQVLREAMDVPAIKERVDKARAWRLSSKRAATKAMADKSHQFCEMNISAHHSIVIPIRSSETREYLPVGLLSSDCTINNLAYALYDAPLFNLAILASRLHLVWIAAVCGKLETRFSYSNKIGWNAFPIPLLTDKNKEDLNRCAEDILLGREAHFPAAVADLYDPERMPADLRAAHERNDATLERIYIGRRFKNDTERLEKLFELYTKMTTTLDSGRGGAKKSAGRKKKVEASA